MATKGKPRGYRDVAVKVGGTAVCVGDMWFAAEALGITYAAIRRYACDHPVAGLEVMRLPELWSIDGGEALTTEQAAWALECDAHEVPLRRGVERVRWPSWSLPCETIEQLRVRNKRAQKLRRREERYIAAG